MPSIICVKIAQRKLPEGEKQASGQKHSFDYFPFDRGYLIPPDAVERIPQLFRAYMVMDLTETLHAALNGLSFTGVFHATVKRNFKPPQQGKSMNILKGLCDDVAGWKMVVPTFLWNEYDVTKSKYLNSTVGYVLSAAVGAQHNTKAELPRITFVSPHQTFPLMCVACLKLPDQLAGNCTMGTADCRKNCSFKLPVDPLQTGVPEEEENHDRIQ